MFVAARILYAILSVPGRCGQDVVSNFVDSRSCQCLVVAARMWLAISSVPGHCGQDMVSDFVISLSLRPG